MRRASSRRQHSSSAAFANASRVRAWRRSSWGYYCSELLALLSKVAIVYVQHFDDVETLKTAGDVEDLTVGLSRNIWQKIMILDRVTAQA